MLLIASSRRKHEPYEYLMLAPSVQQERTTYLAHLPYRDARVRMPHTYATYVNILCWQQNIFGILRNILCGLQHNKT